ncbi:hypothetical protein GUITHDRAFT_113044 [Guillardia theta CCMP2712]|uniref:Uncharacterized protein n=1 Tax=Guillardia theta (strain CCMP2712) TaxID=905079 RepID=L1IY38_GUITC|nr:hypothetical protein GUITHDRAFT_113044 [Guillardia theta CCMP2712]EKX40774.1 hypothetical protein GUITHDRAFT_113044 [Guillardia theta CCMP2712]|eukprot:XP_005827754.1 hypothetical protein GUITHDRAFT_113044 [Guillardia theta CCMP2712]
MIATARRGGGEEPLRLRGGKRSSKANETQALPLDFIPSSSFTGLKPGYIFKRDRKGVGFYLDQPHSSKGVKATRPRRSLVKSQSAIPTTPTRTRRQTGDKRSEVEETRAGEERSAANKESFRTRQEVEAQSMTRKSDFGYNWNIRNEPQDSELDELFGKIELKPPPPPIDKTEYSLEDDLKVLDDAERLLQDACDRGDIEEAKRLLKCGVIWEEERKEDALFTSSTTTDEEDRKVLTQAGFEPSDSSEEGKEESSESIMIHEQIVGPIIDRVQGLHRSKKEIKEIFERLREDLPDIKYFKERPKIATFVPGKEDEEETDSELEELRSFPGLEDFFNPFGARMQKIEIALRRNATDELNSEEQEKVLWLQSPMQMLQEYMSESSEEFGGEILQIKKTSTEITQGELDPWDKALNSRLSEHFGAKEFDVVDNLGFERVGNDLGVRSSDQSYNQIRHKFLAAKRGSYKGRDLTQAKAGVDTLNHFENVKCSHRVICSHKFNTWFCFLVLVHWGRYDSSLILQMQMFMLKQ